MSDQQTQPGQFRRMHRGYLRMFVAAYVLGVLAASPFIVAVIGFGVTDSEIEVCFVAGAAWVVLFWPALRGAVWIYDGFILEREKSANKQPN